MTIVKTLNEYQFADEFNKVRPDQFSYEALKTLYNYLDELYSEEMGIGSYELDVIALCCNYAEYDSLSDFNDNYGTDFERLVDIVDTDYNMIPIEDTERFIVENC
tara:strand:- start:743 stop:1057 length:315 start_codon:yes stop_codon:yes gene_type:complete